MLQTASPSLYDALKPILDCGAQGVDLFFILSGFVLTWNYLDRMGETWSAKATLRFPWLRLARVWPLYLVTMHLAASWIVFTLNVGDFPSPEAGSLTAISYVRPFSPSWPAPPSSIRSLGVGSSTGPTSSAATGCTRRTPGTHTWRTRSHR